MRKHTAIIIFLIIGCFGIFIVSYSNSIKGTVPMNSTKGFL